MAIYFSEKFKNLRKLHGFTQEQVADIFLVSPQAVSRWETGLTCPDIEILPSIADLFNVTVDDLLGIDIKKKQDRVMEIFEQTGDLISREDPDGSRIDEAIDILNNGLREFPNNVYLSARLSGLFRRKTALCKETGKLDEMKKYAEKSLKLSERLVTELNNYTVMPVLEQKYGINSEMRYRAIGNIAFLYNEINEADKAIEWANKLPDIDYTKMSVLSHVLKGEEQIKQLKQNIFEYSDALNIQLKIFAHSNYNHNDDSKECINFTREYEQFKVSVGNIKKYIK